MDLPTVTSDADAQGGCRIAGQSTSTAYLVNGFGLAEGVVPGVALGLALGVAVGIAVGAGDGVA